MWHNVALALVIGSLAACSAPPVAVSPAPRLVLDAAAALRPDAPGADTAGGRLGYNLLAVSGAGELIVKLRKGAPRPAGARAMLLADTWRVASRDRQEDLRRLLGNPAVAFVEPPLPVSALALPNDPDLGRQWGLARIGAPAAWATTQGAGGPLVAIIDTGVDARHPDLAGQVVVGRDFVNGDADAADDEGHGTHVAGIVAAAGDNGVGAAGVAYRGRVLSVKVLDASGSGSSSQVADGIAYAVAAGARVINLSLGSPLESAVMREAVAEAVAAGVVVVAAAGNDGTPNRHFPAAYPGVVAVGATDALDARARFSNHGPWVHIAAPGVRILAPYRGSYRELSGTSMAAPHVAGAVALAWAARPTWAPWQVREALEVTGDAATGFDTNPAVRRLNVAAALSYTPGASPRPVPTSTPLPIATPDPRSTSRPTSPAPTAPPTARPEPRPTARPDPRPTARPDPRPTARPDPRSTSRPDPRSTSRPDPRSTSRPEPRSTSGPDPRSTSRPDPRSTSGPSARSEVPRVRPRP